MSDVAIRIEGLGKQFRLGRRRTAYKTLRESLGQALTAPFWGARRLLGDTARTSQNSIFWALKEITADIRHGEVVGIIGRNGAGKSTLLKVLSRITEPTEGEAQIHGRIGSLLEVGTGFHPELTGRENIFLNGAILGMRRAEIQSKFDEIVAFSEIEKFLDTPVKHYSSGMYVRLAFAVAAHLEPEILIIDEVLAVGDASFQKKCLRKMDGVAKAGRTVLFVSHNMAAITNLCSRAWLLQEGRLVATGDVQEIVKNYMETVETSTERGFDHVHDREGNGRLRFLDLRLRNESGQLVNAVASGQNVTIELPYAAELELGSKSVGIGIGVYDIFGKMLFLCHTALQDADYSDLPRQGVIRCAIPRLPLVAGRYVINLHCAINGHLADWLRGAGTMNVVEGDFFGTGRLPPPKAGDMLVDHQWLSVDADEHTDHDEDSISQAGQLASRGVMPPT